MMAALKISHLEQLKNEIFTCIDVIAVLLTRFSGLKIDHLVKQIGIKTKTPNKTSCLALHEGT